MGSSINPEVYDYLKRKFKGDDGDGADSEGEGDGDSPSFDFQRFGTGVTDVLGVNARNDMRIHGVNPEGGPSAERDLMADRQRKRAQADKQESDRFGAAKQLYQMEREADDRDFDRSDKDRNFKLRQQEALRKGKEGGNPPKAKPYPYVDEDGNKRVGKYYDNGIGLVRDPSDPITEPYKPSVDESKQASLIELGDTANDQYTKAIQKGKDDREYDPTNPAEFIDNSDFAPAWMKSDSANQARSAESAWVESYLRDASGAAIPHDERSAYAEQFFPRPGDDEQTVRNKEALRKQKEMSARSRAGKAAPPPRLTDKIKSFMEKNGITDPNEAMRILKENGRL